MSDWRLNQDTVLRTVDDETILLQLVSGQYYGLDAIGADILETLLAQGNIDATVDTLHQRYQTSRAALQQDVSELVERLQQAQLIERNDASASA